MRCIPGGHGPKRFERTGWRNPHRKSALFHEAGKRSLDDRCNQKDEHKVRGNTTGRMIFSNLGHGSSQGFGIGGNFPPTESTGGIIHGRACQASSRTSICSHARGLELEASRAGYIQTDGFRASRARLSGLIPWRCDRRSGVPLPLWLSLRSVGRLEPIGSVPLPSADPLG